MQTINLTESQENTAADHNTSPSWMKNLPALLRGFGAAAVLLSLYSFLMRGWEGSSDLVRYLMLLGHTGILATLGLASGHYLKEAKGARLLLILALVSVVANFAILGAFILSSTTPVDLFSYPQYVYWQLNGQTSAFLTTTGAMLILLPVIWLGFRVLARGISKQMSYLYLFSNIMLLLPLRDASLIAATVLLLTVITLYISAKTVHKHTEVKTQEGMIALLLQFLPLGVLIGRNIWLYAPESILLTTSAVIIFITLRQCSLLLNSDSKVRNFMELLSAAVAIFAGLHAYNSMESIGMPDTGALISAIMITSAMIYEISLRAIRNTNSYRILATAIATTGLLAVIFTNGGLFTSLVTMIAGLSMSVFSYLNKQKSMFTGGVIITLASIIEQLSHIMMAFDFGYWVTLAIIGVGAILVGSMLESQGGRLKQAYRGAKTTYIEWNY